MPAITEVELKERIKKSPAGAYLICGDESYLVKIYTEKLIKASVDDSFADFNLHIYDGEETDLSDVYESCVAVPMMAQSKCVVVKDYPVETVSDLPADALRTLLQDNPEDNCLIFSYPASKQSGKAFTEFTSIFSEYGYVVKLSRKTEADLIKIVESGAAKRGKPFEKGAAQYFVRIIGDDLNLLGNEIEKVCAYADKTVGRKEIDAVCTKSLSLKTFDMIKELTAGHFDSAFHMLSGLFAQREDEFMILGALISQYSDIYRAKAAKKASLSPEAVADYYSGYKSKKFVLNNAAKISSGLSFSQLGECLEILSEADLKMKSSGEDPRRILEQAMVRLARVGG